jgi:hypothetical protein
MKKRHLAKRPLRFEGLEARLAMSAAAALNIPLAVPAIPAAAAPAVTAPLSSGQAALDAAGATAGKVNDLKSHNWSGVEVYDQANAAGDATQAIQAEWTVPYVVPVTYNAVIVYHTASNWVGLGGGYLSRNGGLTDSNLVQLGTQGVDSPAGQATYSAWWEVVGGPETTNASPANPLGYETAIPLMNIHPGDLMYAEVDPLGPVPGSPSGNYRLSMTDLSDLLRPGPASAGATFVHTVLGETGVALAGAAYTGAEVIAIEATTVNGIYSPLPQLTPVYVSQACLTAAAYVNSATANTWIPIGSAYGLTVEDIMSGNPLNPFGLEDKTYAYPGLASIVTVWLSST